ncbi:MAG: T9SS type A sorting domain-containing protein [bacterium]|nr:T9SS type A sorting domain-containing protein [bacterium]
MNSLIILMYIINFLSSAKTLPEQMVDPKIIYTFPDKARGSPKISFNGTNYLVIWQDQRRGVQYINSIYELYGTRVTPSGTVLDTLGLKLKVDGENCSRYSVTSDSNNFFIAYGVLYNPGTSNTFCDIYGLIVDNNGVIKTSTPIPIEVDANINFQYPRDVSAIFDGKNYIVIWQNSHDSIFYSSRVNKNGILVDSAPVPIIKINSGSTNFSIAYGNKSYLLVTTKFGIMMDSSLQVIDTVKEIPYGDGLYSAGLSVGFNGTDYLVTGCYASDPYYFEGQRVSTNGTVIQCIDLGTGAGNSTTQVASNGQNWLVLAGFYGTRGVIVQPSGSFANISSDKIGWLSNYIATSNGSNYFIAGSQNIKSVGGLEVGIFGNRITSTGTAIDTNNFPLSYAVQTQSSPTGCFDGEKYFMIWEENRTNTNDIYGCHLDTLGNVLDTSINLTAGVDSFLVSYSIAFDGNNYLVAYEENPSGYTYTDIHGMRVKKDGTVLNPSGFPICTEGGYQDAKQIAYGNGIYFLVWRDGRYPLSGYCIRGIRVDTSGVVADDSSLIITLGSDQNHDVSSPDIAFDGTNFLVVYQKTGSGILGKRISPTGTIIDASPFTINSIGTSPFVLFNGINYLVLYQDGSGNICGKHVTPQGNTLSYFLVCNSQKTASICGVWDGQKYIITWKDKRNDSLTYDIYGAFVDTSGEVIKEFPICDTLCSQKDAPFPIARNADRCEVFYSRFTDNPYSAFRLYRTPVINDCLPDIAVTEDTLRFLWDYSGKKNLSSPLKETYNAPAYKVNESKKSAPLMVVEKNEQPELIFASLSSKDALDTLIYDSGTFTVSYWWGSGKRMASRMSPTQACKIMAIQIYCRKAQTYKVGLYNWTGSAPGSQLLETGNVSSIGQGWNTTDVSSYNIHVTSDFIAGFNMIDTIASIGATDISNSRAWNYNGSSWSTTLNRTYFIRAIVSYGGPQDTSKTMTVRNDGWANLHVSNITKNQTWIASVAPTSFTVTPGSSQSVTVIVNHAGLGSGTHLGSLTISSDDPDEGSYVEPVKFVIVSVGTEAKSLFPDKFVLFSPSPNPSMKSTIIKYGLPEKANISLKIYDVSGRLVKNFYSDVKEKGYYTVNIKEGELREGIYFIKFKAGDYKETKKLILMK